MYKGYEVGTRDMRWIRGVQGGYEVVMGYEVGTNGMRGV